MNRYRLTQRGMRETDDPPHPLDWVTLDECQRATGAVEAELAKMRGERDKLAERVKELDDALAGLVDGLDANGDERCGLSQEQWNERIARARAVLEKKS